MNRRHDDYCPVKVAFWKGVLVGLAVALGVALL